jgi:hypothetical protein
VGTLRAVVDIYRIQMTVVGVGQPQASPFYPKYRGGYLGDEAGGCRDIAL